MHQTPLLYRGFRLSQILTKQFQQAERHRIISHRLLSFTFRPNSPPCRSFFPVSLQSSPPPLTLSLRRLFIAFREPTAIPSCNSFLSPSTTHRHHHQQHRLPSPLLSLSTSYFFPFLFFFSSFFSQRETYNVSSSSFRAHNASEKAFSDRGSENALFPFTPILPRFSSSLRSNKFFVIICAMKSRIPLHPLCRFASSRSLR